MHIVEVEKLNHLFKTLQSKGYTTIGPKVRDGAIGLDALQSAADLPQHYTDEQAPGSYTLHKNGHKAFFNFVVGPQSWKKFLYEPRTRLFSARKNGKSFEVIPDKNGEGKRYAFIGVRPCELQAIAIHDKVFHTGEYVDDRYQKIRDNIFLVAINCTNPGGNCFCVSVKSGPAATQGYDLVLTEVATDEKHHFLIESGSPAGEEILRDMPHRDATQDEIDCAKRMLDSAAKNMGKSLDVSNIGQKLNDNFEHAHWDDVAKRCLSCTNCTMVCPTCFCSTVEDVTDLTGEHAERWRRWDSCFTSDFTKIAGGNTRMSTRTRYRQWLMHKFAHWQEQFGTLGCVGCGRCITWCPAGIDITREAARITDTGVPITTLEG
ncbi:MAG: 4Fe-4S dicluster domain-containing protein [Ignavibacteriae bacterium]|nr:4Fe-4S dicluster domain-containing protein [Ignavibacteriota bacterium]